MFVLLEMSIPLAERLLGVSCVPATGQSWFGRLVSRLTRLTVGAWSPLDL